MHSATPTGVQWRTQKATMPTSMRGTLNKATTSQALK